MSFFDKTSYLRAIFVMLPLGVLGLYFGISGLLENESDLEIHQGVVTNIQIRQFYQDDLEKHKKSFVVELDSLPLLYNIHFTNELNKLRNNLNINDKVTIWTREKNKSRIAKLQRGDELIIPYNPTTGIDIIILLIGLILTPLSVAYLIKYRGDLSGGNK